MYIHLLCQQKNRPSSEACLQSWGTAKLFWKWQMLPSLLLVPFFGKHEFGQRFAVWITPCTSSCVFTVSSLELYPDALQLYSPIHTRISCPSSNYSLSERQIQLFSKELHRESTADIFKRLLVLHSSVSGISVTELLG